MSDVAPPDTSEWWDVDTVTAAALAVLRLDGDDVDAARVRSFVPVVGIRIAQRVDSESMVVPDAVLDDCMTRGVVSYYRAKDSPPATDDFGLAPGYGSADPLQPIWSTLNPYRRRFGVA